MWSWLSGSYETFPVPSAFSSPPIRCSRPGVPGIAHGRARVSASRRYGRKPPSWLGASAKATGISGYALEVGDQPRLRAVREVGVREQEDGRPVLERDPGRLDRGVEAAARRRGGDHRHRRLGVPAPHREEEVGLLGLGRHPRGRACALDVDDHERQLERDGEADRLHLQDDAGTARRADAERAAEARAERGADGGDLVLGLERPDAEVLRRESSSRISDAGVIGRRRGRAAGRSSPMRRSGRASAPGCRGCCGRCPAGGRPGRPRR